MDAKPLILIVDDEPDMRKIYSEKLEHEGFVVHVAEDGRAGILAAKQEPQPDLILMDIKMPVMDGVEAFNALKEDPATKNIKIIFLTAFDDVNAPGTDVKFAAEIGAADFVEKGTDFDVLIDKINRHLGRT